MLFRSKKEGAMLATSQESADQVQVPVRPIERIRPKIPPFRENQEIIGSVIAPTDELRRIAPAGTQAFLSYQSFGISEVVMVVSTEEAQNWKSGDTRICVFVREEVRDGCTVLICQPRVKRERRK